MILVPAVTAAVAALAPSTVPACVLTPLAGGQPPPEVHPAQPEARADAFPRLKLQRVAPEIVLRRPVQAVFEPGSDARMYVLEQAGRILVIDPSDREARQGKVFLDITEQVNDAGNEEGLLSLAFHPDFARNRSFFLYYTALDVARKRSNVLSRWTVDPETGQARKDSERILLTVEDPYSNHNGGTILFGRDGMLYLSCGDGGAANDPLSAGQDLGTLLAKILRIDIDREEEGRPYGIPKDNPFVGVAGARPEIWAFGLRNVWRMSFDRKTGELWAADVGQNQWEEVNVVRRGGNYGWNMREGAHAFAGGAPGKFGNDYLEPVVEYPHSEGVSITGGYVSRCPAQPALEGVYVYADLVSCKLWGIRADGGARTAGPEVLFTTRNHLPTSFAEANDGTLYLLTFEGSQDRRAKGAVWRIEAAK